jgi:tetratricopeptide (TPR) repeat protein
MLMGVCLFVFYFFFVKSNRAAAHNELGLFRNVIKDANEALVLDDKCLRAHLWKVKGLLSLGKRADALLAVRAALDGVSNSVCDVVLLRELKQLENQCDGESRKSGSDAKVIPQQSNGQTANDSLQNKIQRVAEEHLVQFGVGDKEVDKQIALGYFHTNSGNYTEAIVLFTRLLKKNPKVVAAFLGRGTALAMSGRLKDGVVDFSHAIGWKCFR